MRELDTIDLDALKADLAAAGVTACGWSMEGEIHLKVSLTDEDGDATDCDFATLELDDWYIGIYENGTIVVNPEVHVPSWDTFRIVVRETERRLIDAGIIYELTR